MLYPAVRRSKSLEDERASKRNIIDKKTHFFKQQSKPKIITATIPSPPQSPPLSPPQSPHEKDWTLAPLPRKENAHSPVLSTGGHRKKTLASSARSPIVSGGEDPMKLVKSLDLDMAKETNLLWNPVDLTTVRNTNYSPPMTLGQPRSPGPGSLKDSGKKKKGTEK